MLDLKIVERGGRENLAYKPKLKKREYGKQKNVDIRWGTATSEKRHNILIT